MFVESLSKLKKVPLTDIHGETCLYQVIWQDDDHGRLFGTLKPDSMKAFTNFARLTLNPGDNNNVHTHTGIEQVYFVLRGEGTVQVGEERRPAKAGDAIFLPADIPHGFFNTSNKQTILLMVGTRA